MRLPKREMAPKNAETQERQIHLFIAHTLLDLEQVTKDLNVKSKIIKSAILTGTDQSGRHRHRLSGEVDLDPGRQPRVPGRVDLDLDPDPKLPLRGVAISIGTCYENKSLPKSHPMSFNTFFPYKNFKNNIQ